MDRAGGGCRRFPPVGGSLTEQREEGGRDQARGSGRSLQRATRLTQGWSFPFRTSRTGFSSWPPPSRCRFSRPRARLIECDICGSGKLGHESLERGGGS